MLGIQSRNSRQLNMDGVGRCCLWNGSEAAEEEKKQEKLALDDCNALNMEFWNRKRMHIYRSRVFARDLLEASRPETQQ